MRIHVCRAVLLSPFLCLLLSGCEGLLLTYVPSETGFTGGVSVVEENVQGGFRITTVELPYLDVDGEARTGLAQVYLEESRVQRGERMPAFCHLYYAIDGLEAAKWASRGWAVFSAIYSGPDGDYPQFVSCGNGLNQARALVQWARRQSFVDRSRLHIDGLSQGGYVAMAAARGLFPVTAMSVEHPVVNWAYNANYVEQNKGPAGYPGNRDDSPMPFLYDSIAIVEQAKAIFGSNLAGEAWWRLSPISYLEQFTHPSLVLAATGDMLTPMEQMTRETPAIDAAAFPDGYQRDFDALTLNGNAAARFEELLDPDAFAVVGEPLPGDARQDVAPELEPLIDRAWSADHPWSLYYLEEGPPDPDAPHTTYAWNTSPDSFAAYYRDVVPALELLSAEKLDRLMQRYSGLLDGEPRNLDGVPVNRLNHAALEQRDVVQGLLDYAAYGDAHEQRLLALYEAGERKPLGAAISVAGLRAELAALLPE